MGWIFWLNFMNMGIFLLCLSFLIVNILVLIKADDLMILNVARILVPLQNMHIYLL
jgi:hypothetical protein